MQQPILTTSQFGESDYGKRLSYEAPKYRDPFWAVFYIIHVIAVIAAGAYLWVKEYPSIKDGDNDTVPTLDFNITGIVVGVIGCMICGALFGVCWLQIIKQFAATIIKTMLFLNIGMWVAVALVGLALGDVGIGLVVIGIIMALFYCLYTWCIWRRIPFSSELLKISSAIVSRYQGTIFISLAVILFNIFWIFIWGSCAAAYIMTAVHQTCDEYGYCYDTEPNNFVIFLLLISMYWGFQVNKNVSHTTTCGVAATWYFSTVVDHKPTPAAFKRTMTTSFGSVCLGSLIVAILQAIRAMLRNAKQRANLLTLIALCLLGCVERLIRYFNKYAYAQCAIYGTSFVTSAKATWNLFMTRGLLAIINDNLVGMALGCGSLIGGIVSAGVGFGIGYVFYHDEDSDSYPSVPIALACYGFIIGLVFCHCVLMVVASAVIALFVCYAEDPASMNTNRPQEYQRLIAAKPSWGDVYRTYGGQQVASQVGPTIIVPPAQPVVVQQGQQQPHPVIMQQPQTQQPQQQIVYAPPQNQQVLYQQPPQSGNMQGTNNYPRI